MLNHFIFFKNFILKYVAKNANTTKIATFVTIAEIGREIPDSI